MYTVLKTRVEKQGNISSYIQKPVVSRIHGNNKGFAGDTSFGFKEVEIGVIVEAIELDDTYELTMDIWDRFTKRLFSFQDDQLNAIYFGIESE